MAADRTSNKEIADLLDQIADLLEIKNANRFRVQGYRNGAQAVRSSEKNIARTAREGGEQALQEIPQIGEGISGIITSYVDSGRSQMLERLQGEVAPEDLFQQVPGIGSTLAKRIAEHLDIQTLEELEQAAHDGRLAEIDGFGKEKVRNLKISLSGMLSSAAQRQRSRASGEDKPKHRPGVDLLLNVDQEYRRKAQEGELRKIAPKRFNPEGEAWLPILNISRGGWKFTALYSNTKRAHELEKTDDWVVIYYQKDGEEDQATVVTETQGPLEGKRVVRGREEECRDYYQKRS